MRTLTLITILIGCLLCAGCFSVGGRSLLGTRTVGGDIEDAKESTQILINSEEMSGHHKTIGETAKLVEGQGIAIQGELDRDAPSAEVIGAATVIIIEGAATIQAEAKAAEKLNSGQKRLGKQINRRAQGKRRWSWLRWAMITTVIVIVLGYLLRGVPFFSVIERALSGIGHEVINVLTNANQRMKREKLKHLAKTKTIATADLELETQAEIILMEAEAKKAEAKALKLRAKNGG